MRVLAATGVFCLACLCAVAEGQQLVASANPTPSTPTRKAAPLDRAVEEFRIQTRDLGLRTDSPAARKKSTAAKPKYHGRIYENLRNDLLDAVPHQIRQRGGTKSLLRRNQFGFNVAGPVFLPKLYNGTRSTFFSMSYEGVRERISRSSLRTIPILPERTGDFSQTVDQAGEPLPIFDPLTTRANPAYDPSQPVSTENLQYLRDPFPGNRIPAMRLDPTATQAVSLYPTPNANAGPFFRNNYFVVSPETNTANGMILKVDHALDERHRFEFSTSLSNGFAGAARVFDSVADPSPSDHEFRSRRGSLQHIWTVSPRTVNTAQFAASTYSSRNVAEVYPYYTLGSYTPMGKINPLGRSASNSFVWSNSLSAKRGKHNLRVHGEFVRTQVTAFSDWFPEGMFSFSSGLTSLPGIVNTGHPFASFLLGLSNYGERTKVTSPSYFRQSRGAVFLREQYEATPTLTVSASVNVEVNTPRVEKYDRQSTVSASRKNPVNGRPGALIAANHDGVGRAFFPARLIAEPTLSVAWSPAMKSRTVVRIDLARRYQGIPIGVGQFGTQGFNAAQSYISSNVQLSPALTLGDGLPPVPALPDLRPDAVNDMAADYIDPSGRMPRTNSASLQVERELPGAMVVTVGLSHADGKNMLVGNSGADPNAIPLDALEHRDRLNDESFRRSLRPFPQYTAFELNGLFPAGRYKRESGFVKLEKRTTAGLALTATYEFVKQLDDYSGLGVQDFYNRDNNWARTPFLNPHRVYMSYAYELPFGPGKGLFNFDDWRRHLAQGWAISGVSTLNSGDPLYLRAQFNNTGGVVRYLGVNAVPGVDPRLADQSASLWFNPAAFVQPDDFTIGNLSRTHPFLSMPGSQNHDLSITKRFPLAAERTVEFSAVGFNFVNHANLTDPDVTIGPASAPNVNAGKIISTVGGRVIQLGLRYSF